MYANWHRFTVPSAAAEAAREYPDLIHSIHPLKLYEYLASGLNVVAVEWDELSSIGSPAYLAGSREQFVDKIRQALRKDVGRDALQAYASRHDWNARMERLLHEIGLCE